MPIIPVFITSGAYDRLEYATSGYNLRGQTDHTSGQMLANLVTMAVNKSADFWYQYKKNQLYNSLQNATDEQVNSLLSGVGLPPLNG